jgi:hypothetical protein
MQMAEFSGAFKKGFDPRRSPGGKPGRRKSTEEYYQKEAAAAQERAKQVDEIESNITPLEYMLRRMRDTKLSEPERFAAARSSAQYMHPQLQAIAHKHVDASGNPIAPVISVTVERPAPAAPRLTHQGPSKGDKVQ